MRSEKFGFSTESGWTVEAFPLTNGPSTLVLVFAAPEFRDSSSAIDELARHYGNSVVMGCSTSGEILGDKLVDGSLSVFVIEFSRTALRLVSAKIDSAGQSVECARALGSQLAGDDLRSVFVLSDGLHVNGSELARELNASVGEHISVSGGLAGDDDRFEKTFVICGRELSESRVVAVGFYGESLAVSHASRGGWDPFGHERSITKSAGSVLFELDGRRALDVYKQYLGDHANELPASALRFPLSVRDNVLSETSLVRTILAVDEEQGSMTFAGDVPEGSLAQFLYGNFDRLIDAAAKAAEDSVKTSSAPVLAIGVSCVGRRLVLGDRAEEELEAVMEALPTGSQMVGFYSYGELSPHKACGCELHNQSFTITTFREAA